MTAEAHAKRVATITTMVRTVIIEQLGCKPDMVTLDANLLDDLGCDSLDAVELTMEFEDTFDLSILDEHVGLLGDRPTVQAVVDYFVTHEHVRVD